MIKYIFKSFFFSGNKFQPVYFWATLFLFLISSGIILKYFNIVQISDALIIGLCGFIVSILTSYNFFKKGV